MRIYNAQQQSGAVPRWQTTMAHEAIGGTLGEVAGSYMGVPHGIGALAGAGLTYGVAKPLMGAGRAFSQGLNTQQAFDQAYPAMTGKTLSPVDTASFQETLRRLGIGVGVNR